MKIVSLVPSLTELLIDLGLEEQLSGRTRFCVHPQEEVEQVPIVGGTKNPRLDKIWDINPDFIIANREENRREDIKALQEDFKVEVTDIATIEEALETIEKLGSLLNEDKSAAELVSAIRERLKNRPTVKPMRTAYLIWQNPWMSVGRDTYIHDVMEHWGLSNVFQNKERYPTFNPEELRSYNPELILLSSEPYPFKEKHMPQVEELFPDARIMLVEGEWFSWYGSRMKVAFGRLNGWRKLIEG